MKIKITLAILLSVAFAGYSFAQNKHIKKNYKKLRNKFSYVRFLKDCNSAIVGELTYSHNDGGGRIPNGRKNIKIASLIGKKIEYWTPSHSVISTSKLGSTSNDNYNERLVSKDGKMGLIHPCKKIILEPKYDQIGEFNNEGLAIALLNDKIDVINLDGKSVLKESENLYFYDKNQSFPKIFKNTIIVNNKENEYFLFDIIKNKIISKTYSKISTDLIKITNEKRVFISTKDGKKTILDENGLEIMPLIFEKISDIVNNNRYISVTFPGKQGKNVYDYLEKKLVFPTNIQKTVGVALSKEDGIWEFETYKSGEHYSVYDTKHNRFIIKPSEESSKYVSHWNKLRSINNELIMIENSKNKKIEIINRLNSNLIMSFPSKTKLRTFKLKEKNKENIFFLTSIQPDRKNSKTFCSLYNQKLEPIFKDVKIHPIDIKNKGNYFYYKEHKDCYPCKTVYTAYDFNGKIIGEPYKYIPKK